MFVDQNTMIALEYIFYQKDGNYQKLYKNTSKPTGIDNLGTDLYDKQAHPHNNAFACEPENFHLGKMDYLSEHSSKKRAELKVKSRL